MKATIDGKRYDTNKCEVLGEIDHYNSRNTYSGTTHLVRASNGQLLVWRYTNGQDCYLRDSVCKWEDSELTIDDFELDEKQEARCVELGLILSR